MRSPMRRGMRLGRRMEGKAGRGGAPSPARLQRPVQMKYTACAPCGANHQEDTFLSEFFFFLSFLDVEPILVE